MGAASIDLVVRLATHVDAVEQTPVAPGIKTLNHMSLVLSLDASLRAVRDAVGQLGRTDPNRLVDKVDAAWGGSAGSVRARQALLGALEEGLEAQRGLAAGLPFLSRVLNKGTIEEHFVAVQVLSNITRYSEVTLPPAVAAQVLACLVEPRSEEGDEVLAQPSVRVGGELR